VTKYGTVMKLFSKNGGGGIRPPLLYVRVLRVNFAKVAIYIIYRHSSTFMQSIDPLDTITIL
jgi:hypothetical protein